ncbi:MAG: hypothetical protein QOH84_4122 [Kribbellaceae bacterium]|jgi:DNA-binding MarR family transcriptional regulator|nr:hypothetical protein [Kribbellaceae bacterium]
MSPEANGDAKPVREPVARARAERLQLTDQQRWDCSAALTPEQRVVLVTLSDGALTRDRVASYLQLPEHEAGSVIDSLIRRSLVGRVSRGGSEPEYGLNGRGMAALQPPPVPRPAAARWPRNNTAPSVQADDGPNPEVRRKLLAVLLEGSRTREQLAQGLGLSEQATGRVLDQAIRDSVVAKLTRASDGPRYCLTVAGRKKLFGVSERLQDLARNSTTAPPKDVVPVQPPAAEPVGKWVWNPELSQPSAWLWIGGTVVVLVLLLAIRFN